MRGARSAESRADLIHKMQMALKEVREAHYWLAVIEKSGILRNVASAALVQEADELTAILVKSVMTAKQNLERLQANTMGRDMNAERSPTDRR